MNARTSAAALLAGVVLMTGCRADREATEGVRLDAPEEIRRAPAIPDPNAPPLAQPGTREGAEAAAADRRPTEPVDRDTLPEFETPGT